MTPYHESDGVTLYHGDNVQTMRETIPDASIDLVVTSPPYDNLRTYGGTRGISRDWLQSCGESLSPVVWWSGWWQMRL